MIAWRRAGAVLSALALTACASVARRAAPSTSERQLASADKERVRAAAPDLFAYATRALAAAERAHDEEERSDEEAIAALWLAAARAEADRIAAERASAAAEVRFERASRERAELGQRAFEAAIAERRNAQAAAAKAAARAAFAPATEGGSAEHTRPPPSAARIVCERAELLLAAAIALGFPPARAEPLEAQIAATEREANPQRAAVAAERALTAAESALGEARSHLAVSSKEIAALLELAAERGLASSAASDGVVIALDDAFAAASSTLSTQGRARLAQIAALARAHPHGLLRIAVSAPDETARTRAQARAASIERELGRNVSPKRLELGTPELTPGTVQIHVVFTGYVLNAAPATPTAAPRR